MQAECLDTVRVLLRDFMVCKATESKDSLILQDKWEYIRDVALHTTYRELMDADRLLVTAKERMDANVNAKTALEMFFMDTKSRLHRTKYEAIGTA